MTASRIGAIGRFRHFIGLSVAALLLAACGGNVDAPAAAVEDYLQAVADKDADRLAVLSCAEWEEDAQMLLDSFAAVEVTLDEVSCQTRESQGDNAFVECSGALAVSYEGEIREFALVDEPAFHVVQASGTWLVCGTE